MNSLKSGPIISPLFYGKLEKALGVLLRIPGLFIIDNYCRSLLTDRSTRMYNLSLFVSNFGTTFFHLLATSYLTDVVYSFFINLTLALLNGFLLLLLPLAHLKRYYLHLCCCTLLLASICLSYDWLYIDKSGQDLYFFPIKQYLSDDKIRTLTSRVSNQNVILHLPLLMLQIAFDIVSLSLLKAPPRKILLGCFCCTLPYIAYFLQLSVFCLQVRHPLNIAFHFN